MEQQPEDERSGRLGGRPPIRLPLHRNSSRRSRSLSPFRHDDDANMYALSRPAGEAGDSGDEPSLVRETAPTRAEEPTDYYRRPPPPRDEDYHHPPPRAYDDALADIRPTIEHITARMIHHRNKAAMSGLDSKAIMVETLATEAWMKAFADREIDAAQEMTNGPPPRPPANPGNAPPPPQGPTPPVSDNSPLPFNQSYCDFGAVMQKLRTMDGPKIDLGVPLSEMEAWVIAETDRAGLASLLIMNRMYCYAHQESVRRSINSSEPGISRIPAPGPTPDQVELAKYRNALTAAKRALTEIRETSDDASARAASALAEISKALESEER